MPLVAEASGEDFSECGSREQRDVSVFQCARGQEGVRHACFDQINAHGARSLLFINFCFRFTELPLDLFLLFQYFLELFAQMRLISGFALRTPGSSLSLGVSFDSSFLVRLGLG
jgi:hypothetical protein